MQGKSLGDKMRFEKSLEGWVECGVSGSGKAFQVERQCHTEAGKSVRALTWLTAPTTLRALEVRASQNWAQRGS